MMFNISIYLDKFKKVDSKNSSFRDCITSSINKVLGVNINKENITVRNGVVYLKTNSVIRNEIFIKKKIIMDELVANNIPVVDVF